MTRKTSYSRGIIGLALRGGQPTCMWSTQGISNNDGDRDMRVMCVWQRARVILAAWGKPCSRDAPSLPVPPAIVLVPPVNAASN
jgi:hypothetical protein